MKQKQRPVTPITAVDDLRVRRWPRRLFYGFVLLALITAGVVIGVPLLCETEFARKWTAGWIERRVDGPVALESVSASWTGAVELHGIEVGPPPGFGETPTASIQRVEVPGGLLGLIRNWGGPIPLRLDGVRLHIERDRAGALSIERLRRRSEIPAGGGGEPGSAPKANEWGVNADLAFEAGALTYADERLGVRSSFRRLALEGGIRDGMPRRVKLSAIAESGGSLAAELEVPILPRGEDGRPIFDQASIRGEIAVEDLDLMPYAGILDKMLRIRPPRERVSLAVKGAVSRREFHLEKLLLDAGFFKARGSDGRIRGPLSGAAEGAIALNVEGSIGRTLECLAPLLPGREEKIDGRLLGELRFLAAANNLRLASALALSGLTAGGGLLGDRELRDLALKIRIEGELAPSKGALDVDLLVVDGPGLMFRAGGGYRNEAGHPVAAKGELLCDLQGIRPILDPLLGWKPEGEAKGRLGVVFDARAQGGGFHGTWKVTGEELEAVFGGEGADYRVEESGLNLEMKTFLAKPGDGIRVSGGRLTGKDLAATFTGTVGLPGNSARGTAVDLEFRGQLGLREALRRLRPLLPDGISSKQNGTAGFRIKLGGMLGPAPLETLTLAGTFEGSGLVHRGLIFENFSAPLRLEKGVLSSAGFAGAVNGGSVTGSLRSEPAADGPGPGRLDLRARGLGLSLELLPILAHAAPFLAGRRERADFSAAFDLDLQRLEWGAGRDGKARVARGAGNLSIRDGHLSASPLVAAVFALAGLPPGTLRFKEISTAFFIAGGRIHNQDLRLRLAGEHSLDRAIQLSGSTGLDGSLDYILRLAAVDPPARGKDARRVFDVLEGALGGVVDLPIRLRGTLARPRLEVDSSAADRRGGRDPLGGRLDGILERKFARAAAR